MKPKAQQSSTQQQISEQPWVDCPDGFFCSPHQQPTSKEMYAYFEATTSDWTEAQELYDDWQRSQIYPYNLIVPNPPTPEMIERAQFKDKTYRWNGR